MSGSIPDPIAAMNAAAIAVKNEELGEIELRFVIPQPDGIEISISITVRRDVQHINVTRDDS